MSTAGIHTGSRMFANTSLQRKQQWGVGMWDHSIDGVVVVVVCCACVGFGVHLRSQCVGTPGVLVYDTFEIVYVVRSTRKASTRYKAHGECKKHIPGVHVTKYFI